MAVLSLKIRGCDVLEFRYLIGKHPTQVEDPFMTVQKINLELRDIKAQADSSNIMRPSDVLKLSEACVDLRRALACAQVVGVQGSMSKG